MGHAILTSNFSRLLDGLAHGVQNANAVVRQEADPALCFTWRCCDKHVLPTLLAAAVDFEPEVSAFMNACPLVTADRRVVFEFSGSAPVQSGDVQLCAAGTSDPASLWSDWASASGSSGGRSGPVDAVVTPFPGLAEAGPGSFLHRLLGFKEPTSAFGSRIAAVVVKHKWDSYAAHSIKVDFALWFCSLVVLMAASVVGQPVDADDRLGGADRAVAAAVLFGLAGLHSLRDLGKEAVILARGPPRGYRAYVTDLLMLVHLLSTGLTIASVALYFAGSRGDLGTTLGAAVFTKWLDAFFYLQVRQSFRRGKKKGMAKLRFYFNS